MHSTHDIYNVHSELMPVKLIVLKCIIVALAILYIYIYILRCHAQTIVVNDKKQNVYIGRHNEMP